MATELNEINALRKKESEQKTSYNPSPPLF